MQNRIYLPICLLSIAFAINVPAQSGDGSAAPSEDVKWLRRELGVLDRSQLPEVRGKAAAFESPEKQARLVKIIREAKAAKAPLDEERETSLVLAGRLLVESGYDGAVAELKPLLKSENRDVRKGVAQSLAMAETSEARTVLESTASEKVAGILSSDPNDQLETVDLVRCALLGADPAERQAVLDRLVQRMKTVVESNPETTTKAETMFREIKSEIDRVK